MRFIEYLHFNFSFSIMPRMNTQNVNALILAFILLFKTFYRPSITGMQNVLFHCYH